MKKRRISFRPLKTLEDLRMCISGYGDSLDLDKDYEVFIHDTQPFKMEIKKIPKPRIKVIGPRINKLSYIAGHDKEN